MLSFTFYNLHLLSWHVFLHRVEPTNLFFWIFCMLGLARGPFRDHSFLGGSGNRRCTRTPWHTNVLWAQWAGLNLRYFSKKMLIERVWWKKYGKPMEKLLLLGLFCPLHEHRSWEIARADHFRPMERAGKFFPKVPLQKNLNVERCGKWKHYFLNQKRNRLALCPGSRRSATREPCARSAKAGGAWRNVWWVEESVWRWNRKILSFSEESMLLFTIYGKRYGNGKTASCKPMSLGVFASLSQESEPSAGRWLTSWSSWQDIKAFCPRLEMWKLPTLRDVSSWDHTQTGITLLGSSKVCHRPEFLGRLPGRLGWRPRSTHRPASGLENGQKSDSSDVFSFVFPLLSLSQCFQCFQCSPMFLLFFDVLAWTNHFCLKPSLAEDEENDWQYWSSNHQHKARLCLKIENPVKTLVAKKNPKEHWPFESHPVVHVLWVFLFICFLGSSTLWKSHSDS